MKNHKIVEAILFICGNEGCAASELRGMVQLDSQQLVDLIGELNQKYKNDEDSPFIINLYDKRYYLLTKPDLKPVLEKLNITTKYRNLLSKALIEILSIILWNENCTAAKIQEIRGVDPNPSINKLLESGYIEVCGRSDGPGRPYCYKVSSKFYNHIGVKNQSLLPKLDALNEIDDDVEFFDSNRGNETMTPKDIIDAKIGEKKPKETSEEELSNDTNQENIVENNEVTNQDENIVDNNQLSIGKKNTNNAVEETEKEDENEPKITLEETN